jgi:D-serine deaminase-like pyridoxal phosphate-dependent protein
MSIDDLPTPALLVDVDRLEASLRSMQARADAEGVALRPHIKTHKSLAVAGRQRALGCRGITCAKPSEAAVFVDGGFDDVRIAYPLVSENHFAAVAQLMERARVSFCVDTLDGARAASRFFARHGRQSAEVLLKVDCGYGRVGVAWDDPGAPDIAAAIAALPGLELTGILTHAGHAYNGPQGDESQRDALVRVAAEERDHMLELATRLRVAGVIADGRPFEISIGSTPTAVVFEGARRDDGLAVTEIRPGNYAFFDLTAVSLGACSLADCAFTVLATVISLRPGPDGGLRGAIDAGKKVLTSDQHAGAAGFGLLLADAQTMTPLAGATLPALSEEHGWLRLEPGVELAVGDRVRLVPNHSCVVASTQDRFHLVRGDDVIETCTVDARGRVT